MIIRSQRPAIRLTVLVLVPLIITGVVSAVFSAHAAGAAVTLDVLIGARSAFTEHAGAGGVVLAVVGYLFVPALAGTLVAEVWSRVEESRPGSNSGGQQ